MRMIENFEKRKLAAGILKHLLEKTELSPRVISVFTKIPWRTLYRWGSGDLFLPPLKDCDRIVKLAELIGEVRGQWKKIIAGWNGELHKAIQATLYKPTVWRILGSNLDESKKADKLTAETFLSWARLKKGYKEDHDV